MSRAPLPSISASLPAPRSHLDAAPGEASPGQGQGHEDGFDDEEQWVHHGAVEVYDGAVEPRQEGQPGVPPAASGALIPGGVAPAVMPNSHGYQRVPAGVSVEALRLRGVPVAEGASIIPIGAAPSDAMEPGSTGWRARLKKMWPSAKKWSPMVKMVLGGTLAFVAVATGVGLAVVIVGGALFAVGFGLEVYKNLRDPVSRLEANVAIQHQQLQAQAADMQEQQSVITLQDARMRVQQRELHRQAVQIRDHRAFTAQQTTLLHQHEATISSLEATIARQTTLLHQHEATIASQAEQLAAQESTIQSLGGQLKEIKGDNEQFKQIFRQMGHQI